MRPWVQSLEREGEEERENHKYTETKIDSREELNSLTGATKTKKGTEKQDTEDRTAGRFVVEQALTPYHVLFEWVRGTHKVDKLLLMGM